MLVPVGSVFAVFKEPGEPADPVALRHHEQQQHQAHEDQQADEHPSRRTDEPQQRQEDDEQDGRRSQVLAAHHEQGEHPGAWQQRDEHVPPVGEHAELLLAGKQVRAPHGERELGELGRLEPERAGDGDPPGRAVHVRADAGNEHKAEPDRRYRKQRVGRGAEQPGRAPGRHPHDGDADDDARQLHLEVAVGRLAPGQVDPGRGGQHHDEAEAQQQRGDARDQVVRGERTVEQRARRAEPSADAREDGPGLAGVSLLGRGRPGAGRLPR